MGIKRLGKSSNAEYTVSYNSMHGVDFSDGASDKRQRFSRLENMYRSYEGGGAGIIESIPGFRSLRTFNMKIHSIFSYKDSTGTEFILIHAEKYLYRYDTSRIDISVSGPPLMEINDGESCAFTSGTDIYILDGAGIVKIDGDGNGAYVEDDGSVSPYVPITYRNGKEYEQRNLLTDKFSETYLISAESDSKKSLGLIYKITSESERLCEVAGIEDEFSGALYIPEYTDISGVSYKVTAIASKAFYENRKIVTAVISDSVARIGEKAFCACNSLEIITMQKSVTEICDSAISSCSALKTVYLGSGLTRIGEGVFAGCPNLGMIYYGGSMGEYNGISNSAAATNATRLYNSPYTGIITEIPVFSPAVSISSLRRNQASWQFMSNVQDGRVISVIFFALDSVIVDNKEFTVNGIMSASGFALNSAGTNFLSEFEGKISGHDAIIGCRIAEAFDGRIFLSGNESLPNTVFYSSRDRTGKNNPLYFGILNYFNDGIGAFRVESMLSAGESLAVFKSGDDGGGSIYYHVPRATDFDILPVIYPVTYIHSGVHAVGQSISFFDDPIFISSLGVTALDKKNINLERSIAVRSHNINPKLLAEDLKALSMTKWCGYLVIAANGSIYLGDSRDTFTNAMGSIEYEWYYLTGIGAYSGAEFAYKYSSVAHSGFSVHPRADEYASGTVRRSNANGETFFYIEENGIKYEVYKFGEKTGGEFSPAVKVHSTENDMLFFATERGELCVFNNYKRGKPPLYIQNPTEETAAEYKSLLGRNLHPYYYSFDSHAPRYAFATVWDNCGFQNLEKSTVKGSLTAKLRLMGGVRLVCEAETDRDGSSEVGVFQNSGLDFSNIDFSALAFSNSEYITLAFGEREKRWTEKKISFYSENYESPFGICNISYRFKIKGKIKNR